MSVLVKKVHHRHGHQQVEILPAREAGRSCLGGEPGSVGVRRFLVGVGETPQSTTRAVRPVLLLSAVPEVRIVIGVLSLVAAESTAELLLALRALVHEATCALRTAEATGTLGSHAEATETGLHTGRGLAVPGARVRLVAELAERGGGWAALAVYFVLQADVVTYPAGETWGWGLGHTGGRKRESAGRRIEGNHRQTEGSRRESARSQHR